MEKKGFKFQKPLYPKVNTEEDLENEDEEEAMVADETIVDDAENEETLNEAAEDVASPRPEEYVINNIPQYNSPLVRNAILGSKIDPAVTQNRTSLTSCLGVENTS